MKGIFSYWIVFFLLCVASCRSPVVKNSSTDADSVFRQGEYGYDLRFLRMQDSGLIVLKDGEGQVIVSPKYQAKIFTSTASGERGASFGWINCRAFRNKPDAHMNAYGGENRIWLGPEGGKYSLFFAPGTKMVFENWKTPAAFDTEGWILDKRDSTHVTMSKEINLLNYAGTRLHGKVTRSIVILGRREIFRRTGMEDLDSCKTVGYETLKGITNTGDQPWTKFTGMPCIWILDMFTPSPQTVIIIPFRSKGIDFAKWATTNYFGEIPEDRIKHDSSILFFKADGKSRGKLGVQAGHAREMAGSYDAESKVLTVIQFDISPEQPYLNQEWNIEKPSFSGDAVNAYNDGPLADGNQMGPFYEIESVSPAAFLKPDSSIYQTHSVYHFSGSEKDLDKIAIRMLGVSLDRIKHIFPEKR
jgi:hypothetical protein